MALRGLFDIPEELNSRHIKDYLEKEITSELRNYVFKRRIFIENLSYKEDRRAPQFIIKLIYFIGLENNAYMDFHNAFVEEHCIPAIGYTRVTEDIERRQVVQFFPAHLIYMAHPEHQGPIIEQIINQLKQTIIKDIRENYIDKNVELYGIDLAVREAIYTKSKTKWIFKFRRNDVL
jgi:hypothetical protein